MLAIADCTRQHHPSVHQPIAPNAQHRIVDISQPNFALRARLLSERTGQVAGASGDIQYLHAGAHCRPSDGERLPDSVQPSRHQVIHDVVARGH